MKVYLKNILLIFFASQCIAAEEKILYLESNESFINISDKNREAEAWATCSAVYQLTASFYKDEQPNQAKVLENQANGAKVAVLMSHFDLANLRKETSVDRFRSTWKLSQLLAESMPETRLNMILADAERLNKQGSDIFINKISATLKVCHDNLEGQQVYIDLWRDLYKSGLLSAEE